MPRRPATRRASDTAESEQQPPCFSTSASSSRGHCCRVMPTTSCPAAWSSAAATEESTPPERATATFMLRTLLDDVALDRLHADTPRLEISDPAVELVRLAGHLQQHPAFLAGHVRPADVGHDLVVLADVVDHRLGYEVAPEDEPDAAPGHSAGKSNAGPGPRPRRG